MTIDTAAKTVHTSKGNTFSYDILVLATGSAAGLPPYVTPKKAQDTKGHSVSDVVYWIGLTQI